MKFIGAFIAVILVGVPVDLLRAFVLTQMWGWFIVPLGVPGVGLWHAYGLVILASFFRKNSKNDPANEWWELRIEHTVSSILTSLSCWASAAVIAQVMP